MSVVAQTILSVIWGQNTIRNDDYLPRLGVIPRVRHNIGDTVNVASRIENLTCELKTPLTVSEDLVKAVRDEESDGDELLGKLVEAGPQEISGRKQKMNIWVVS